MSVKGASMKGSVIHKQCWGQGSPSSELWHEEIIQQFKKVSQQTITRKLGISSFTVYNIKNI